MAHILVLQSYFKCVYVVIRPLHYMELVPGGYHLDAFKVCWICIFFVTVYSLWDSWL